MSIEKISANKSAKWIGTIFVILSSITTFMFFWTYMPAFINLDWLGAWGAYISPVLSGIVGVLLLDYPTVKWLQIYLHGCDDGNNEQRSTAKSAFYFDFAGSAVSSGAYLILSADNLITLDASTREWIGIASIAMIALAVIFNFYSKLDFDFKSNTARDSIRQAERMGKIAEARREEEKHLDDLIAQKTREKLASQADAIAETRADSLASDYQRIESAKSPRPSSSPAQSHHPTAQYSTARYMTVIENPDRGYEQTYFHDLPSVDTYLQANPTEAISIHERRGDEWHRLRIHKPQGNGITHRVNPINRGEDVTPAGPQRHRVASEGQPATNFQQRAHGPE